MNNEKTRKILMVEDDSAQALMYKIEFKNFGFDLQIVEDGSAAYGEINKVKPELVLLDMLIGKVSGYDVLKKIKESKDLKDIKVIIMSNYNKKELNDECIKAGALDYWVKSDYVPRQIVEKVQTILK